MICVDYSTSFAGIMALMDNKLFMKCRQVFYRTYISWYMQIILMYSIFRRKRIKLSCPSFQIPLAVKVLGNVQCEAYCLFKVKCLIDFYTFFITNTYSKCFMNNKLNVSWTINYNIIYYIINKIKWHLSFHLILSLFKDKNLKV